jgi:DNA replication protein DnaC
VRPPIDARLLGEGPLAAQAEALWAKGYWEIGLPLIYRGATLEGDRAGVVRMREFMEEWGKCLLLLGDPGVGKTYASAAAIRHEFYRRTRVIEPGESFQEADKDGYIKNWIARSTYLLSPSSPFSRFVYLPKLLNQYFDPARRPEALKTLEIPFLVLDDLGTEYLKDGGMAESFMDELFYEREANRRTTIITTNLNDKQLIERYSPRIIDRLRGGWGSAYVIPGPSLRRRAEAA